MRNLLETFCSPQKDVPHSGLVPQREFHNPNAGSQPRCRVRHGCCSYPSSERQCLSVRLQGMPTWSV